MVDSEDEVYENTPPNLKELANIAKSNTLPKASRKRYDQTYNLYIDWKNENKVTKSSENCLLAYFEKYRQKYKPTTVWAHYSMLKATIKLKENIDISKFFSLTNMMKNNSKGFQPKKAKVFSASELKHYLAEAPHSIHLASKVVVIFGISGCCRGDEITQVQVDHIKKEGKTLIVDIPKTKTYKPRQFTINAELSETVNKYWNLRPENMNTTRFFINYQNNKCTKQVIGTNKVASVAKQIATWLKLEEPHLYTGHALRRTAATLLSNSGGIMMDLKLLGGWESDRIAQGYVENSALNETKISNLVTKSICSNKELPQHDEKRKSESQEIEMENFDEDNSSPTVKRLKNTETSFEKSTSNDSKPEKIIYINNSTVTITF